MKLSFAALATGFLAVTPALATGSFSCTVNDKNLSFEAHSPLGTGMGEPIISLSATAQIKLKRVPKDLTTLELSKSLVHSWVDYPDLRLLFYKEQEADAPHGYVELVVKAKEIDDEGNARGEYELTVFSTEPPADKVEGVLLKAKGKVSCFVE